MANGLLVNAVYRYHPATITPHFRMFEVVARYSVLHDPSLNEGPDVINDDGSDSQPDGTSSTRRELQVGGNYYITATTRLMGNAIVPLDDREHVGVTLIGRLQVTF